MGEFAIELRDVGKSYGSVNVLNRINLRIEPGIFTVFVGPSGCGKSTLLRMIAGLEEISTGDLYIEGTRMNDTHPAKREVAMVFQSYALYPNMTVAENIGFSLRLASESKDYIADRVRTVAQQLQLDALLDRKPSELSGGQRQRVAIGRAIIRNPRVFLFDEPLSNLDAALRVHMRLELEKLHDELKTTMVYVTHDQVEAMTLADKIVVLNDGNVQQVGSPIDLYLQPANRFVAGFIGSPAMNFLKAELGEGGVVSVMDTHSMHLPVIADSMPGNVTLGIRPEHLKLDYNGSLQLEVTINQQELLGAETLLYTKASDGAELLVRAVGIHDAKPGDRIIIGADLADLHLFQGSGGEATRERSILDHNT